MGQVPVFDGGGLAARMEDPRGSLIRVVSSYWMFEDEIRFIEKAEGRKRAGKSRPRAALDAKKFGLAFCEKARG
jgi:hypothetical protein